MTQRKIITGYDWLELLLLGSIWGAVFLATAIALQDLPVFTTVAGQVTGGAIALWAYILIRRRNAHSRPRHAPPPARRLINLWPGTGHSAGLPSLPFSSPPASSM